MSLKLRGATWPFELKVRAWVPVQRSEDSEEKGFAPLPADETNLRGLLDPSWLRNNSDAVDMLHEVFGFRQLTLMLDSLDTEVENDLVELLRDPNLVKSAVENSEVVRLISEADPEEIQEIMKELENEIAKQKYANTIVVLAMLCKQCWPKLSNYTVLISNL